MVISVYGRVTHLQELVNVFSAVAKASEVTGIVRELRKIMITLPYFFRTTCLKNAGKENPV